MIVVSTEGQASAGSGSQSDEICTNTCRYANDGDCDDGGPGADFDLCDYGTDCNDCGPRPGRGGGSSIGAGHGADEFRAYFTGELGMGLSGMPIYEDVYDDPNCGDHCASEVSATGMGPTAEFRLAPVFLNHFGFDISGRASLTMMPGEITSTYNWEAHAAGRVFLGFPQARVYGGYEYGQRSISRTRRGASASDSFAIHAPLAGIELCLGGTYYSPRYCNFNLGLDVAFERPEIGIPSQAGPAPSIDAYRPVYNLRIGFGNFFLEGMYAPDYPLANPPGAWQNSSTGQTGIEVGSGTMAGISLGFSGDIMNDGGGALLTGLELIAVMMGAMDTTTSRDDRRTAAYAPSTPPAQTIDVERNRTLDICNVWRAAGSGGQEGTLDRWDISQIPRGATFDIRIDAFDIPDRYEVEYPGMVTVLDTGWRGDASYDGDSNYPGGVSAPGQDEIHNIFRKTSRDEFTVKVFGVDPQTQWEYEVRCRY